MKKLLLCAVFFLPFFAQGQIVINEVMSRNASDTVSDLGENSDWIELYNAGTEAVDLLGYGLSDDVTNLTKWTFNSSYILEPGEYLLVYASREDIPEINDFPDPIDDDLTTLGYSYADNSNNTPGNSFIEFPEFDGTAFGTVDGEPVVSATINYLDNDVLGFSYAGVFCKFGTWGDNFDRSAYQVMRVYMDLGEGEKVEVRFVQTDLDAWLNFSYPITGTGEPTWYDIPITNAGGNDIGALDLTVLEGIEIIGTYPFGAKTFRLSKVEFASIPNAFHTNFSITSSGEIIYLLDPNEQVIDNMIVPQLGSDHSFGRTTDGAATFTYFSDATPNASNGTGITFDAYGDTVTFSQPPGFYWGTQQVELSADKPIYYTLDGSDPTVASIPYSGPISIDTSTVIRAIAVADGNVGHPISTATYVVDNPTELPVFSLSMNPWELFSDSVGIYALGPDAESQTPHFGANFWQDWERQVHLEYFDTDGELQLAMDCGIEIFGNWSKSAEQKSFKLKAKSSYGPSTFDYKFFDNDKQSAFQHLILRNSGGDFGRTQLWDASIQDAIEPIATADKQDYEPAVVYLNGAYWGIMNLRHHMSIHYIEEKYHLDRDDFSLEAAWGEPLHGTATFEDFIEEDLLNYDMANQANYEAYIQHMEIENYIDHFAMQTYIGNWDWPQNNLKVWKENEGGQYRYMTYDLDLGMALYNLTPVDSNTIKRLYYTSDFHSKAFRHFLENEGFRFKFINRVADYMNSVFRPDIWEEHIARLSGVILNEMPRHRERWELGDMETWENQVDETTEFMEERRPLYTDDVLEVFDLTDTFSITINAMPAGAGKIKLSTLKHASFPWTGVYFQGVPVTIEALPNSGFSFDRWEATGYTVADENAMTFDITGGTACSFVAHFSGEAVDPSLVISELMYNNPEEADGEWVEFHNNGVVDFDLSGWYFEDENNFYQFPEGTVISPDDRLVLCNDISYFETKYPLVFNAIPGMHFNLSNGGERIRLSSPEDTVYLEFTYDDSSPWPTDADGRGYTLELGDVAQPQLGESWFRGCLWGSPGYFYNAECELGIDDPIERQVELFPNPNSGTFSLLGELEDVEHIHLVDQVGVVFEPLIWETGLSSAHLNFGDLPAGLYLLNVQLENGQFLVKKVMIQE